MAAGNEDLPEYYRFCKDACLTSNILLNHNEALPARSALSHLKKGLILELLRFKKENEMTWYAYRDWIQGMTGLEMSVNALRKSVLTIESKKCKLEKSVHRPIGRSKLEEFLHEEYHPPSCKASSGGHPMLSKSTKKHSDAAAHSQHVQETHSSVNKSLAAEIVELKKKLAHDESMLTAGTKKVESIALINRNLKKKLKRRDVKLIELSSTITTLRMQYPKSKQIKSLTNLVRYYKTKYQQLKGQLMVGCPICIADSDLMANLKEENISLQERNKELHDENAVLLEKLSHSIEKKVNFYNNGKYSDKIRLCIMELLTNNVSILKIELILSAVFKLLDVQCDKLPQRTTINEILIESRSLSHTQIADILTSTTNNTLHSDGTTKFGHKYQSYQVTTSENGSLTLGLQEVVSGEAETTLQVLQNVLQELSETAHKCGITKAAENIIVNIKNTMSDRAASQKSFNNLLATYRTEILPEVITNWNNLSDSEQSTLTQMHNFYCGMHLIVNMAEHTSETLKLIERNYDLPVKNSVYATSEANTIRLIRTACKAFERRGDEKNGCPLQFNAYLKRKGCIKNQLIHFRGNRFNILFANGARIYYLHQHIVDFLKNWGTPNRLLQAVLEDSIDEINIAGTKALGLIDKHITGPLWRVLESDIHVLDVPNQYLKVKKFFERLDENNIALFMTGEDIPFSSELINKDDVWQALVSSSSHDLVASQMLLSIFKTLILLMDRVLADLQPVFIAKQDNENELQTTTRGVPKTNTISERDFAKLDRLIREKPNASTLALEAHILFANNKTSQWFSQKSAHEKASLMEQARKNAPRYRKLYHERMSKISDTNIKLQEEKERKKEEVRKKEIEMKEKITSEIINYGLWQTVQQMVNCLDMLKSETQKRTALKSQLRFRKMVLQQEVYDDSVYRFSSKEQGQFTSTMLSDNLVKLLENAENKQVETASCCSISHITGKKIKHKFQDNGKSKSYKGKVISQVPGFPAWFNIVYTNEPNTVYTYDLTEDIANGDLIVL